MVRRYDSAPVLVDLPAATDLSWRFGGYPCGLEPLTLPYPAGEDTPEIRSRADEFAETYRLIAGSRETGPLATDLEPCRDEDTLFWYRWIVGHQATFVIWRLTAQLLDDIELRRRPVTAVLPALSQYLAAYNAMLLYTGSCTAASYGRAIRPSMQLRHPGFSGTWAPDYAPIRLLLRGRLIPAGPSADADRLGRVIAANKLVHEHVAAKLVPDGVSLLRSSVVAARRQDQRVLNLIYDNYFLTIRGPVTRSDVVAQLLRRLLAIVRDVEVNGLAGDESAPDEIVRYRNNMVEILIETARVAAGVPERAVLAS